MQSRQQLSEVADVDLLAAALQGPDGLNSSQLQQLQQRLAQPAAGNSDLADMQVDWSRLDTNATDPAYAGPGLNAATAAAAGNNSFHPMPAHSGQDLPQSPFVAAAAAGRTGLNPTARQQQQQQQFMPAHSGPGADVVGEGAGNYYEAQSAALLTPWVHNPEPPAQHQQQMAHQAAHQQQLLHQAAQEQHPVQPAQQAATETAPELNPSLPSLRRDLALLKERRRLVCAVRAELVKEFHGLDYPLATLTQRMLKTSPLSDKVVEYRKRDRSQVVRVTKEATITPAGQLCCTCCDNLFHLTGFEEHSLSTLHRPTDNIYITDLDISLKAFAQLLMRPSSDIHLWYCATCGDPEGGLVTCAGCPAAFHYHCLPGNEPGDDPRWRCGGCRNEAQQRAPTTPRLTQGLTIPLGQSPTEPLSNHSMSLLEPLATHNNVPQASHQEAMSPAAAAAAAAAGVGSPSALPQGSFALEPVPPAAAAAGTAFPNTFSQGPYALESVPSAAAAAAAEAGAVAAPGAAAAAFQSPFARAPFARHATAAPPSPPEYLAPAAFAADNRLQSPFTGASEPYTMDSLYRPNQGTTGLSYGPHSTLRINTRVSSSSGGAAEVADGGVYSSIDRYRGREALLPAVANSSRNGINHRGGFFGQPDGMLSGTLPAAAAAATVTALEGVGEVRVGAIRHGSGRSSSLSAVRYMPYDGSAQLDEIPASLNPAAAAAAEGSGLSAGRRTGSGTQHDRMNSSSRDMGAHIYLAAAAAAGHSGFWAGNNSGTDSSRRERGTHIHPGAAAAQHAAEGSGFRAGFGRSRGNDRVYGGSHGARGYGSGGMGYAGSSRGRQYNSSEIPSAPETMYGPRAAAAGAVAGAAAEPFMPLSDVDVMTDARAVSPLLQQHQTGLQQVTQRRRRWLHAAGALMEGAASPAAAGGPLLQSAGSGHSSATGSTLAAAVESATAALATAAAADSLALPRTPPAAAAGQTLNHTGATTVTGTDAATSAATRVLQACRQLGVSDTALGDMLSVLEGNQPVTSNVQASAGLLSALIHAAQVALLPAGNTSSSRAGSSRGASGSAVIVSSVLPAAAASGTGARMLHTLAAGAAPTNTRAVLHPPNLIALNPALLTGDIAQAAAPAAAATGMAAAATSHAMMGVAAPGINGAGPRNPQAAAAAGLAASVQQLQAALAPAAYGPATNMMAAAAAAAGPAAPPPPAAAAPEDTTSIEQEAVAAAAEAMSMLIGCVMGASSLDEIRAVAAAAGQMLLDALEKILH